MPDRCTDPSCLEHWPADVADLGRFADRMTEWADAALAAGPGIAADIARAMNTVAAAPAYKHDCQAEGCADE
jgi:hypothetical protein